jgi:paraquat-inducible protein B
MRRANPTLVGAFVLGALALAVAGVFVFGGGRFFADRDRYLIFFDGSVNGLQVGSPVKLQGVEVGQVVEIHAIADVERREIATETLIEIDRTLFEQRGPRIADPAAREKAFLEGGLRARLDVQSLITGQLYVSLLVLPGSEARLAGPPDKPYPEIASVPSTSQEVQRVVRSAVEKFEELPIQDIFERVDAILSAVNRIVEQGRIEETVANLNGTLDDARGAIGDLRRLLRNVDGRIEPVADSALATLEEARRALESAQSTVSPESAVAYRLGETLSELSEAARALRELAVYLERNPNSVVFGRPPGGK